MIQRISSVGNISGSDCTFLQVEGYEHQFIKLTAINDTYRHEKVEVKLLFDMPRALQLVNALERIGKEIYDSVPLDTIIDITTGKPMKFERLNKNITVEINEPSGLEALFG